MGSAKLTHQRQEREERRLKVARLWAQHRNQTEIAKALGVNQSTVSRDLQVITARWVAEAVHDVGEIRARELAELDEMEKELAARWLQERRPEWMRLRLAVKERRAKLLGLDMPVKIAPTTAAGEDLPAPVIREIIVELPDG
jgi:IS30 family transposase